jgi:hypothetical protein
MNYKELAISEFDEKDGTTRAYVFPEHKQAFCKGAWADSQNVYSTKPVDNMIEVVYGRRNTKELV